MNRLLIIVVLIFLSVSSVSSEHEHEIEKKVRESAAVRDYDSAIAELEKLQTANKNLFADGDHDYQLARLAESNGNISLASVNYDAVIRRGSSLKAYALKHLSQIARSTGNLMLERMYLSEILLLSPGSSIADGAHLRLAHNYFESSNYFDTIRVLTSVYPGRAMADKSSQNKQFRDIRVLQAQAYLRIGNGEMSRSIFTDLINNQTKVGQPDDAALLAVIGLDTLDGITPTGPKAGALTEAEHMNRAHIYQFNRDFDHARFHWEAVIALNPTGQDAAEAAFQIGRGFVQKPDYVEALKWFERVLEQYPASAAAKDALLQSASAYARVGRTKEATLRYQVFIDKFPADEKLDRAYLNIVDILRDRGEDTEALKWCAKTGEVFKGKVPESVALFAAVRIYFARSEWQKAFESLDLLRSMADLGGIDVPGGTSRNEVTFLRGFVLENLTKYSEAIDEYLSLPDGRDEYYGWRATERLRLMSGDEAAKSHIAQKVGVLAAGLSEKDADHRRRNAVAILRLTDSTDLRERASNTLNSALKSLPRYQGIPAAKSIDREIGEIPDSGNSEDNIVRRLLSLGIYDDAADELAANPGISNLSGMDNQMFLAVIFKRGDRADRALSYIEPIWKKIPHDYPIDLMPRDQAEMLYPAPFTGELVRLGSIRGVDPRLILAIMRQESRYHPGARSSAAARGLMQFISTTSTRMAHELGRENFHQDDLYRPTTAILFGSHYLAGLFRIFPNQPDAVAASYNGGEENMKRWMARSRSNLAERYVPEILYSQSKDYVYKVMANYRMYQHLYDEKLMPRRAIGVSPN